MIACQIPADVAVGDRLLVMKPKPLEAKTGRAAAMVSARSVTRMTTEERRVNSNANPTIALAGLNLLPSIDLRTSSVVVTAAVSTVISVPLPVSADHPPAYHVEAQGQHEEDEADEEQ